MEETLIEVKTAIKAKEKGFNVPTLFFAFETYNTGLDYIVLDQLGYGQFGIIEKEEGHNNGSYQVRRYSLPTQGLLSKWLREVHFLHITIQVNQFGYGFMYSIIDLKKSDCVKYLTGGPNHKYTYEQALEEGLIYALNLINNENVVK